MSVKNKIALVQDTFKRGKEKATTTENLNKLNEWLLELPKEFISVAYEGASMGVAIKSIEETNSLNQWNKFYNDFGLKHSSQMHVGLGWAFAELNLKFKDVDLVIDPVLKYRVLDGYGYYEGIFKRRQSIRTQQVPQHFNEIELRAYNQGLGRSLWYIAQGEVEKLVKLINIFAENRHNDMWRGIGIAVAYVGGVEALNIEQLVIGSGQHLSSFKSGVALLIQSRAKAGSIVNDTENISNILFNTDTQYVNDQVTKLEKETIATSEASYFDWLKKIE